MDQKPGKGVKIAQRIREILLIGGVLSSLLYAATDIAAANRWEN